VANFELCFGSFVLFNEDFNPPQYKAVPDPVKLDPAKHTPEECDIALKAQAISGINSYFWPKEFAEISALPQTERGPAVANFYRINFWNKWFEQMTSNRLAAVGLDAAVNQGAGWACKFIQGATGSEVDGMWGPNTVAAANAIDPAVAVPVFVELRKQRYEEVGGPSLPQWLARAEKIPSFT
jgi:hypothetical protein